MNGLEGDIFELNIVPHTLAETVLEGYRAGQKLHLEVDLIARYLERLLSASEDKASSSSGMSVEFLAQHGFYRG